MDRVIFVSIQYQIDLKKAKGSIVEEYLSKPITLCLFQNNGQGEY